MVERLRDCPAPSELVEYQYSAKGFYGWRGEFPFQEMAEKHDYTGYEDLKCMDLVIKTGVTEEAPSGVDHLPQLATSLNLQKNLQILC